MSSVHNQFPDEYLIGGCSDQRRSGSIVDESDVVQCITVTNEILKRSLSVVFQLNQTIFGADGDEPMSIVVAFNRRQIEREAPLTERDSANDLLGVEMIDLDGFVDAIADVHHHVCFEKARQAWWERLPVLVVGGGTIGCK